MSLQPRDTLLLRLRAALAAAMKTRDATAVGTLRSAPGAIDNAGAVAVVPPCSGGVIAGAVTGIGAGEAARRQVTESSITDIVRTEVADREAAAIDYERLGRHEPAARLRAEAAVLVAHLDVD
jgi:uncharacterized protein